MDAPKAILKMAWPYQQDTLNMPVDDLETALPFYETVLGFQLILRHENGCIPNSRDAVQIGLADNGGNPTQDGCFFEVDDVQTLFD